MAPQWMPQNIQKRLLLFVLQQLSLFSGIDIDNLDVSLGSSSQITLNDVEIDTDAFKIPGIHLRNGKIRNLQLQLNMSGGVNFDIDGLFITMALAYTSNQPSRNLSKSTESMLQSILSDHSKETIAQSTIDLAQSLIQDEDFRTPAQSFHQSLHGDQEEEGEQQSTSTLNAMMSKAVELALSKLNVNVKNTSVRVIMDHATVDLEILNSSLATENGVRTIKLGNITVLGTHPSADPGEFDPKNKEEQKEGPQAMDHPNSTNEDYEDTVDDEDDSDDDEEEDDSNEMMASSILQKTKDLDSSLIYSKEQASSIYMSAASDTFEARRRELVEATRLVFINEITVTMREALKIEKLHVEVDTVRIAAVPLPLTILHIFESLGVLNPQETYQRPSNISQKLRQQKRDNFDDGTSRSTLFESLQIKKIEMSLFSALLPSGCFSMPERLRLVVENAQLNQKDPELVYGSVRKLHFVDAVDNGVGWFDGDTEKNDIRFEKNIRTGAFTLLLYKDLILKLNKDQIQKFVNLFGLFPQVLESLSKLGSKKPVNQRHNPGSTTIQTSNIQIILEIDDSIQLSLKVSPLSYDSKDGSLTVKRISIDKIQNDISSALAVVSNSEYQTHSTDLRVRTFNIKGQETVVFSKSSLSVKSLQICHSFKDLILLKDLLNGFFKTLEIPSEEIVFKTRKRARIASTLASSSRPSIKLHVTIDIFSFEVSSINEKFGDIVGSFSELCCLIHKDGSIQLHLMKGSISREFGDKTESLFKVINPDDKSAPLASLRTKNFKKFNVMLKNSIVDYYTEWLGLFENSKTNDLDNSGFVSIQSDSIERPPEEKTEVHLNLLDVGIGLNPGRLKSKSVLVVPNGNSEVISGNQTSVKAELRSPTLQIIDDRDLILSHERAKRNKNYSVSWSEEAYFNSKGFVTVAKSKSLEFHIDVKSSVDLHGLAFKALSIDIFTESLDLELCADSSQCLVQLVNDLKQPVIIKPESKYKVNGQEVDVFSEIEQDAFNERSLEQLKNFTSAPVKDESLDVVDDYYHERAKRLSDDILDKSLGDLKISESPLANNPFYEMDETADNIDDEPSNSVSTLMFDEGHFEGSPSVTKAETKVIQYPMLLNLKIGKVSLKIYDGYDWKFTRNRISTAVRNLEQRVTEQQKLKTELVRQGALEPQNDVVNDQERDQNQVFGETLFDSIHVSLPRNSEDPSKLTQKINKSLQNVDENTIEFGKNNIKKLKLHRTKFHKVLIELNDFSMVMTVFSNQDPTATPRLHDSASSDDYEIVNETIITVSDFEITDNVPTSTWNKFATLLKDIERENGSVMLNMAITTVRPVLSSAATEIIVNAEVLPLRLHVDQDTLEVLTRFGEFKDSRFQLLDEFDDVIFIQKFTVNSIKVKLDYKPKKVDYAGLRSGHTTEFMNLFILDEATMVLKSVTLYGVSGFAKLGVLLNGLWMPDIRQTQLTGVLSGLAPVRSIYKIGANFKDLVVIPMNEYKKDGRIYRSISKGVTEFGKNTTNEVLKFGIKLANGTQALLENAEYALGGTGSSARLSGNLTHEIIDELSEDEYSEENDDLVASDNEDGRFGFQSQLIGRGSLSTQHPMSRSTYQPALESIADITQEGLAREPLARSRFFNSQLNRYQLREDVEKLFAEEADDESQRTLSLYANQPSNLKEGLLLAYDSLGRNFLVAKDAITNARYEINDSGSAQSLTVAIAKAAPIALLRPIIGATEAASRTLYGINNELDPNSSRSTADKYKQIKK